MTKKINIAIDGYSGLREIFPTAKQVAKRLGYLYIDSGAMYRAVTLFIFRNISSIWTMRKASNGHFLSSVLEFVKREITIIRS